MSHPIACICAECEDSRPERLTVVRLRAELATVTAERDAHDAFYRVTVRQRDDAWCELAETKVALEQVRKDLMNVIRERDIARTDRAETKAALIHERNQHHSTRADWEASRAELAALRETSAEILAAYDAKHQALYAATARIAELTSQLRFAEDEHGKADAECEAKTARIAELEMDVYVVRMERDNAEQSEGAHDVKREAAETALRELRERVDKAMVYAGGRWSEWGGRAEGVYDMLDEAVKRGQ